jgi:hypothetical protein
VTVASLLGKTPRLAVPLYLTTLLIGLLPTTAALLGLVELAGDRPWRGDLLGPGWLDLTSEIMAEAVYTRGGPGLSWLAVAGLLLLPLALLLQVIAYSFLAGGILEGLGAAPGEARPFGADCRRWFWPFFRLSLLGEVIILLVGVAVAALTIFGGRWLGPDVGALLQLATLALVLGWLELARAVMVRRSLRSVGAALAQASRIGLRPLVPLIWLLLALPSAGLLLVSVLPPRADDPSSARDLLVALLFGQAVAFLAAWTRVVRLAVATRLAHQPSERASWLMVSSRT